MSVKKVDEIIKKFLDTMPESLRNMPEHLRQQIRSHMQDTLTKMDFVSREEFEVQKMVLLRTREKLEALEKKLDEQGNNTTD